MFGETKQKYVRLEEYDEIIIFPTIIEHSRFYNMHPISAGFCYIGKNKVTCFGESISLGIKGKEDDSELATNQIFGYEAAMNLKPKTKEL